MAFQLSDFWKWNGKTDRKTYTLVGFIGALLKQNIDRSIATYGFHFQNTFFNYWAPLSKAARLDHLSVLESKFLLTVLLASLPFLWIGVVMTVRRLRDVGRPVWLTILFFIPFFNLIFFLVLCVLPPKTSTPSDEALPWPRVQSIGDLIPKGRVPSAILAIVLTTIVGLVFALIGTMVIGSYGWSLFVALPFCLGLFSVLLHSYHEPRSLVACLQVSVLPVVILGGALVGIAVEGLVCIAMAAPLALVLAVVGGMLGYSIQSRHWGRNNASAMMSLVLAVLPASFGFEFASPPKPPMFAVRSAVEIKASPERVWQLVVAFAEIPPPREMLFRAGIAYPIRAEIVGRGPGAVRHCVFSTGPFVEPIEVWDEPRLLKFGVTANPAPLNELSPYGHISPAHLHGYFVSRQGQFALTPLPNGNTLLEGTTWYEDALWPAGYWRLWSDHIIHRIHMRVLEHIKNTAESENAAAD